MVALATAHQHWFSLDNLNPPSQYPSPGVYQWGEDEDGVEDGECGGGTISKGREGGCWGTQTSGGQGRAGVQAGSFPEPLLVLGGMGLTVLHQTPITLFLFYPGSHLLMTQKGSVTSPRGPSHPA